MMKKGWSRKLAVATGLAVALAFAMCVQTNTFAESDSDSEATILDNVYIGDVDVSGMTAEEASEAVNDYIEELTEGTTVLVGDIGELEVDNTDFGLSWDNEDVVDEALAIGRSGDLITRYKDTKDAENKGVVLELGVSIDTDTTAEIFAENEADLETAPVENSLKRENGKFVVVEGSAGVEIDVDASVAAIESFFDSGWSEDNNEIELVCNEVEPSISVSELEKVQDLLGSYSTNFSSSSSSRATNVSNGASKINGTILMPGESFSVYDAVSPFTEENGYELAGTYVNGQVEESFGGGICQVSSTLYNAILYAELEVDERYNHSMIVTYVDPSRDAAIAGTYKDFKFTNNTDAPVYIEGYTSGGIITFNVYGEEYRDADREVEYESETLSTTECENTYTADSSLAFGTISLSESGHTGYTACLWKIVTEAGVEVSRDKINSSTYKMTNNVYLVGTKGGSKKGIAALKKAIATNDKDKIEAAIAKWADDVEDDDDDSSKKKSDKDEDEDDSGSKSDSSSDDTSTDTTTEETTTDTTTDTTVETTDTVTTE